MIEHGVELAVVRVAGESDLSDAGLLLAEIEGKLAASLPVVVGLGDATFIDAAILQTLVAASGRAQARGLRLVVLLPFSAAPVVRKLLLELTAMTDLLTFAATMTTAVRLVHEPAAVAPPGRLRELRRSLWRAGMESDALRRQNDELRAELRALLQDARRGIGELQRARS